MVGVLAKLLGRDSSVGIATRYGLDDPGSNPRVEDIFRTRPDRSWVPPSFLYNGYRVFPGVKRRGVALTTLSHLAPRLNKEYRCTCTPPLGLVACSRENFTFNGCTSEGFWLGSLFKGYGVHIPQWVKWPGCDADHSFTL